MVSPLFTYPRFCLIIVGEKCLFILKGRHGSELKVQEREIPNQFSSWRNHLPDLLQIQEVSPQCYQKLLPITLIAASYRVECILYHALKKKYHGQNNDSHAWAKEKLRHTMFELDSLIGRAITLGLSGQYSQTMYVYNGHSTQLPS